MSLDMRTSNWLALVLFPVVVLAQQASTTPAGQTRSVRVSFLPPPLEGKISLGIYDENDQLVRVLHQEADLDEFTVGADALVTKWDGKDDFGYDLWPGTYHARGYLVAPMKIEEIPAGETEATVVAQPVKVKLMGNPLERNERPTIQIVAGVDEEDVLLKTADGLPLLTVTQAPEIKGAALTSDAKGVTVFVGTATGTRRFIVTGLSKMMAFDCGEFALR